MQNDASLLCPFGRSIGAGSGISLSGSSLGLCFGGRQNSSRLGFRLGCITFWQERPAWIRGQVPTGEREREGETERLRERERHTEKYSISSRKT